MLNVTNKIMENRQTKKINKTGFMMMEAVLGIFILGVTLVSFLQIISKTYASKNDKVNIIIATSLAQEGVELVRNVRDQNWRDGNPAFKDWATGSHGINYNTASNADMIDSTGKCGGITGCQLTMDPAGFYRYDSMDVPKPPYFGRSIRIVVGAESCEVKSIVTWGTVANLHTITISDTLTNWGDKVE